jgi:DNA-binding GntR family transcriptional regulator
MVTVMVGQYRPGDHLGEEELAKHLGVSRGTVREALRHQRERRVARRFPVVC